MQVLIKERFCDEWCGRWHIRNCLGLGTRQWQRWSPSGENSVCQYYAMNILTFYNGGGYPIQWSMPFPFWQCIYSTIQNQQLSSIEYHSKSYTPLFRWDSKHEKPKKAANTLRLIEDDTTPWRSRFWFKCWEEGYTKRGPRKERPAISRFVGAGLRWFCSQSLALLERRCWPGTCVSWCLL